MENDKITNKHPGGRPLKFKNEKELQKKIDAWLKSCKKEKRPLTITGLALALGTGRNVLIDYENREEFSNTIKRAKLLCENYAEESLFFCLLIFRPQFWQRRLLAGGILSNWPVRSIMA